MDVRLIKKRDREESRSGWSAQIVLDHKIVQNQYTTWVEGLVSAVKEFIDLAVGHRAEQVGHDHGILSSRPFDFECAAGQKVDAVEQVGLGHKLARCVEYIGEIDQSSAQVGILLAEHDAKRTAAARHVEYLIEFMHLQLLGEQIGRAKGAGMLGTGEVGGLLRCGGHHFVKGCHLFTGERRIQVLQIRVELTVDLVAEVVAIVGARGAHEIGSRGRCVLIAALFVSQQPQADVGR